MRAQLDLEQRATFNDLVVELIRQGANPKNVRTRAEVFRLRCPGEQLSLEALNDEWATLGHPSARRAQHPTRGRPAVRIAYADPPYPGCAHLYADHPDYAGEVDHLALIESLITYDGWLLHTSSVALTESLYHLDALGVEYRIMAWVKPFAAFKRNVPVAYAWEPVLVHPVRKPKVAGASDILRDWIAEPVTLRRGLVGAKPERVCWWAFDVLGAEPDDELRDLFPGTGAVTRAWQSWCAQRPLPFAAADADPSLWA